MARMFNTDFDYKGMTYTATIIVSGHDNEKTIAIQVPETLHNFVPEGKIVVQASEVKKRGNGTSKARALIKSILAAVEKHEEAKPPLGIGSVWS